jgi:hypothetical protein
MNTRVQVGMESFSVEPMATEYFKNDIIRAP